MTRLAILGVCVELPLYQVLLGDLRMVHRSVTTSSSLVLS